MSLFSKWEQSPGHRDMTLLSLEHYANTLKILAELDQLQTEEIHPGHGLKTSIQFKLFLYVLLSFSHDSHLLGPHHLTNTFIHLHKVGSTKI